MAVPTELFKFMQWLAARNLSWQWWENQPDSIKNPLIQLYKDETGDTLPELTPSPTPTPTPPPTPPGPTPTPPPTPPGPAPLPTPGGADWWQDQPYGAQWLNRLKLGGQIGAGGAPTNPYQQWSVGQGTRARNLNWMQNMAKFAGGQEISPFGSADIPWGGGRGLFSGLAGLDPQSPTGSTFAGLSPEQAMSMARTAGRGYMPELMRQQMDSGTMYNRYLAGAGSQAGAQGFAPWLSEYYGF